MCKRMVTKTLMVFKIDFKKQRRTRKETRGREKENAKEEKKKIRF